MILALISLLDADWQDMLWNANIDLQVVVFGAPLVFGDPCTQEGVTILKKLTSRIRCYVHQCDIVPRLLGRQSSAILKSMSESQYWSLPIEGSSTQNNEDCHRTWASVTSNVAAGIVDAYKPHGKFLFVFSHGAVNPQHFIIEAEDDHLDFMMDIPKSFFWFISYMINVTCLFHDAMPN